MDKTNGYILKHWYIDRKRRDLKDNPKGYSILHGNVFGRPGWPDGEPMHSSPIVRSKIEEDTLIIYTENSTYRCQFEDSNHEYMDKAALSEWIEEPVDAFISRLQRHVQRKQNHDKDLMLSLLPKDRQSSKAFLMNFSPDAEYYFVSMLLVKNGKAYYSEDYDVHVGMFQDSILLGIDEMYEDQIWHGFDFRYFPFGGNRLEFYVWDKEKEPVFVYNSGKEGIEVDCPYGKFIVLPGETEVLAKYNTQARIDDSIAPSIDKHNQWDAKVYPNGMVGYGTPKELRKTPENFMNPPEDPDEETEE